MHMSERRKIRVGIVFGGQSAEHEISILSARNVLEALDRSRFEPVLIGIDKTGRWLAQDDKRWLAGARDPRQAHIEAGVPLRIAPALAAPVASAAAVETRLDVVFPVLH